MLTQDQSQMVLDNMGLVKSVAQKLYNFNKIIDYEERVSIGTLGLIKAVLNFDSSRNFCFSSYAYKCILNEINSWVRENYVNKVPEVSLNASIEPDNQTSNFTYERIISSSEDFQKDIINEDMFIYILNTILNSFKTKKRLILLYWLSGLPNKDIARIMNLSYKYMLIIFNDSITELRRILKYNIHRDNGLAIKSNNKLYEFSFNVKSISRFKEIFEHLLKNIPSVIIVPKFQIIYNDNRITIKSPKNDEFFAFIARIIQEIETFNIL